MELEDFMNLYGEWEAGQALKEREKQNEYNA
jgi:hypothetical protein